MSQQHVQSKCYISTSRLNELCSEETTEGCTNDEIGCRCWQQYLKLDEINSAQKSHVSSCKLPNHKYYLVWVSCSTCNFILPEPSICKCMIFYFFFHLHKKVHATKSINASSSSTLGIPYLWLKNTFSLGLFLLQYLIFKSAVHATWFFCVLHWILCLISLLFSKGTLAFWSEFGPTLAICSLITLSYFIPKDVADISQCQHDYFVLKKDWRLYL